MRSALTILSLVAVIAAEAPYHLPRPGVNAPVFNYNPPPLAPQLHPSAPAAQVRPLPHLPAPAPQPIQYPSTGYQYQQPNIGPTFIQPQPAPQPISQPAYFPPAPQPQPQYIPQTQPQPQYIPQPQPQPLPQYIPQPQPQYIPQPRPQPQPQPLPIHQPQPVPISQPRPVPVPQPSPYYGLPQPIAQPEPIRPLPAYIPPPQPRPQPIPQPQPVPQLQPQPFPQSQPAPIFNPIQQQPQQIPSQQGYQYQQSQPRFEVQQQAQPQFSPQLPLQSQQLMYSAPAPLSSYQADSNQYSNTQSQEQTHREALDSLVVDRVQKIITDNEHSSARNAGYQSLISGVSLENARPSLEISSFVHTSPLTAGFSQSSGTRTSSADSSASVQSPSTGYGFPTTTSGNESQQSSQSEQTDLTQNFLPDTKPATSYGPPN